ncbi:MAG: sulfatase [Thermoplasmata archaeon]|jgi:arylsulfatase A-like enzyme
MENKLPGERVPSRPLNIVTIVLDCARAKNFATSGGDQLAETPAIDSLAAQGTAFPRAVAPANWTVPSHLSIFTGLYPNVHGIRTYQKRTVPLETTASSLREHGYETAMFTENVHLVGGYGLEHGFDVQCCVKGRISEEEKTFINGIVGRAGFLYSSRMRKLISRLPPLITPLSLLFHSQEVAFKKEVTGEYVVTGFDNWLASRSPDRPFYAFFNLVDTHDPYDLIPDGERPGFLDRVYLNAPRFYVLSVPGFQSHMRPGPLVRGYVKSIEAADRKIGRLLRLLEKHGEKERTMVIVTSDHGEAFGELGNYFHGCGATDSVLRVPLVVSAPRGITLPRKVDRWVSLCEVDSWVKAAAAGGVPYDDDAHAPFPYSRTAPDYTTVYGEGGPASDQIRSLKGIKSGQSWNHRLLAAYRGDEKYVLDFDTSAVLHWTGSGDPDLETPEYLSHDSAAGARREVFGPYETAEAARLARSAKGPEPVDVEIDRRLRSWGYD